MSSRRSRSGGQVRSARRRGGSTGPRGTCRARPRACRLRLVAAITRRSTAISLLPPTRRMRRGSSTRSSFGCRSSGSSPISSRNTVPPLGQLERALRAARGRAGERALLVAEQLALDQRAGERAAVDDDERPVLAPAVRVERAREHVLAGAGLALDQHRSRRSARSARAGRRSRASPGRVPTSSPKLLALGRQELDALRERRELELDAADRDHRAGLQVGLADLGAVEERAVGRAEIAQQVALGVAHDLAVVAADRLVGEHEIVVGALPMRITSPSMHVLLALPVAAQTSSAQRDSVSTRRGSRGARVRATRDGTSSSWRLPGSAARCGSRRRSAGVTQRAHVLPRRAAARRASSQRSSYSPGGSVDACARPWLGAPVREAEARRRASPRRRARKPTRSSTTSLVLGSELELDLGLDAAGAARQPGRAHRQADPTPKWQRVAQKRCRCFRTAKPLIENRLCHKAAGQ